MALDIPKEMSFEGLLRLVRLSCAVVLAEKRSVDVLSKEVVKSLRVLEVRLVWLETSLTRLLCLLEEYYLIELK